MEHFYKGIPANWFDFQDIYSRIAMNCPDGGTITEVGSFLGESAAFLAVELKNAGKHMTKIHCIDVWDNIGNVEYSKYIGATDPMEAFMNNLKPVIEHIVPIRSLSSEAAVNFRDGTVDAVFIDACHEYDSVRLDIEAWWPKMKKGNNMVFGGHDFGWVGVRRAVGEFFGQKSISIHTTNQSWFVIV